jgi:hypothetical protein
MPLDRVPASPFIALKGRAWVIACGKGKKMRERKRKTKKSFRVYVVFLLIWYGWLTL